ncbi:MAG: NAD(P)/FAD-dependent oxidoreductase [Xanthobacteraceae bacterium]
MRRQVSGSPAHLNLPHVVIVGAGFAGLEAAKALARSPVTLTILDQQNYHCFQPLLYQVATAALSPADIAWPVRGILRTQANARVLLARVSGLDAALRIVTTTVGAIPYDYLIIASGSRHFYFGHDAWEPHAPGLKRIEDATRIRARILLAFERAELTDSESVRRELMTFVIVGGGPTGVEMAGAIAEMARQTLKKDFRQIDPALSRIVLLEAGPRILPALPENLSRYSQSALQHMGVDVRTSERVLECDAHGVTTERGRIGASCLIWAAGVQASPAALWLRVQPDRNGRVPVASDLSVPGLENVFAIGDTAAVTDRDGRPVPGLASAAKQMGGYVGELVAARVAGRRGEGPFRYRHYGELATIGRRSAVVKLGRVELTGVLAWLFWSVVHIYFLIGTRNRLIVALSWFWNYLTYQRGARLITSDNTEPMTTNETPRKGARNPQSELETRMH